MIAVGRDEHQGLLAESAESNTVDDAVAVALEYVARAARTGIRFRMQAAARA
jgi:hypothetical protein